MSRSEQQRNFYQRAFAAFGDDARSLGWRSKETQYERFFRLSRCFSLESGSFTVHEIGCGLGHFGDFLRERFPQAQYSGSDICESFVETCRERFSPGEFHLRDVSEAVPTDRYDYVTLSGTFNPRLDTPESEWQSFIESTLRAMFQMARKGIGANFLAAEGNLNDAHDRWHLQPRGPLLDFVARLSRHFEFDAGGPLLEFTLRVYRREYIRACYSNAEFDPYFAADE